MQRGSGVMFSTADYQLVDFGDGRKLERVGPYLIDRPCPVAAGMRRSRPELWSQATARFELHGDQQGGERGCWIPAEAMPQRWTVAFGPLRLEMKPTDFGHLGVFPEQAVNWEWIAERVHASEGKEQRVKVLNLFAHTGGSTLAAAQAGADVVHVDSSKSPVAWARRNAELSGLASAPIRWIVEDAARFVHRELHRGNQYDAVILDPPSYGHGPAGETWKLDDDLPALLAACAELTVGRRRWILLTCHTPSVTPAFAQALLAGSLAAANAPSPERSTIASEALTLLSANGSCLPCGIVARQSQL